MNDNNNFEESMKDLELIVEKLEKGEQNLEKSLQLFEEGVEISKKLNDQLKNAEKKVSELMNISKDDLSYLTRNTFNFNIQDSSNENDNFLRIKIRKLINQLKQNGLSFEKFNLTLKNLNESNKAIEFYVKKNISENTRLLSKKKFYNY